MHQQEIKVLWRGGALLAAASLFRLMSGSAEAGSPLQTESVLDSLITASRVEESAEAERSRALEPGERLNPNTATADELMRLPGIGRALAARIVGARSTGGVFRSLDDLVRVPGIGPKTVERLAPSLDLPEQPRRPPESRSRGAKPPGVTGLGAVAGLNAAPAVELERLPGVGPVLAARIVQYRADHGPFETVDELVGVPGIGPAKMAVLRAFLSQQNPWSR